jgi:two-component sensor histidine kinase
MQRFIPRDPPSWPRAALIALATTAVAWLVRAVLLPVLANQAPYATFFASVILAGVFAGWRGGLLAALMGGLAGNLAFVGEGQGFALRGTAGAAFILYLAVTSLIVMLIHNLTASLARERELNEHLTTVSSEYRHRIKNLLAVAQALVHQTGRSSQDVAEFEIKVVDRMHALARAQDLLFEDGQKSVRLRALVGEILRPFGVEERLAWPLSGPDVLIPADSAVAVALLLNELATNATKHGALSTPGGRLKLGWGIEDGHAVLDWKEVDGPRVTPPSRQGFGSRLFDNAMPRASGTAALSFDPDGVGCEIRIALAASAPVGR